jgi:hypothetical protein
VDLGLQKALGVGGIHKPALVEVVDKAQLRQRTELVVELGGGRIGLRAAVRPLSVAVVFSP